jgi:hypothetical protein
LVGKTSDRISAILKFKRQFTVGSVCDEKMEGEGVGQMSVRVFR